MRVKIVLAIAGYVLLVANAASAQSYAEEALIISRIRAGGSARVQGMGGVQNSLGGDISSAYYNPAGLGMFNHSDISFTPGYAIANSSSSYLGNNSSDSKTSLTVPNFGIAFHSNKDGSHGLLGGTFAINFNRTNDFNNTFSYHGTNKDNSIIDYFLNNASGTDISQFNASGYNYNTPTGLAYFNYLIGPQTILDPNGAADQYFTDVTGIPVQTEVVKTTGSQNQWSFSYGVNFNDKIFVGGGLGLTSFHYNSDKTYTESFSGANQPMTFMQLDEHLSLSGSGINATLGTIIRPVDQVQLGFSVATPTSYQISDNYNATMNTNWINWQYDPTTNLNGNVNASTDNVTAGYNLSTPWRFSGGATFFIQKHGFISADAEWLNYSTPKYSSNTGDDFSVENKEIKGLYKSVLNLRIGGEYRLDKYRFRAGYNFMPDPFLTQQNGVDRSLSSYSVGLGYRTSNYYLDFAVVMGQGSNSYRPYSVNSPSSPLVTLNHQTTTIAFTVGFPF